MSSTPEALIRTKGILVTPASVFVPSETFISTATTKIIENVLDLGLSFVASIIGVVTNTLVIAVFCKQGFKDSVSVSMTTIAVWDLIKCFSGAMQRFVGPMELISPPEAQSWRIISQVIFTYSLSFSTYVTSALAAYVAVERCLCVCFPLHVKWLLTRKISAFMCITISLVVFGSFSVIFGIYDIVYVWNPRYNASVAIYKYNTFALANKGPLFQYYNLIGIICPCLSFVVITFCTGVIAQRLRQASSFRNKNEPDGGTKKQQLSSRDRQVVKMLLVIIAIYIISLFPRILIYFGKFFVYEFYFLRKYHNFIQAIFTFLSKNPRQCRAWQ
ncbi:uncharacterized protein LOC101860123 [Aplysia californica]|uniref:Uncharacterized protein LOC101860123 n=1 Tax=Aplysia californica TaxID=6500 RepID=A0ABM0K3W2_APLCA|nr:uncharacterized protein LOC101860123 [Aplysia californica]